ncbi:kinase-like domain-containing protein [Collybia nuda]|uniref:mitogen-activated protein kinase n=1 Tax=Collybia nuda TaxID=64659 RepID=A0A9P6CI16_9AGAR|nr:kinase-like domain-containing protein [Collybia nuda]
MAHPESPGGASPRGHRRRGSRTRSIGKREKSSSPVPSPGSWNVDRGRSRVRRPSNPFSEDNLKRKGYHSLLSSFGKVFHVEKRWKLIREMGSGAYGVVISAADEISGETVAIKLVTRVFDKIQLAKRALRELTLLRHFAGHENITGLIDVDAISPDFNEIYIFMEPMEADLHQIIKSGQSLTNEHVQYFLYQILRGMKYVHSASVIHRDLKPGNLLVNADCELKICDFGLSRGFEPRPDEQATHLTEYVATRWYRAPEIMLAFRRYSTAIDVWSIGCILAELLLGKPLFKGKDYVDQLNKILDVLGTPDEKVIKRIGSEKAQAYVRSLPFKKTIPFRKLLPAADPQALDLLAKLLAFDPMDRITVPDALEHPWLASYHDEEDEPTCPVTFEKWTKIEELETLDEFREALWNEIEDYRREVRGINLDLSALPIRTPGVATDISPKTNDNQTPISNIPDATTVDTDVTTEMNTDKGENLEKYEQEQSNALVQRSSSPEYVVRHEAPPSATPADPVMTYARRSSILQPSRQGSTYNSPLPSAQHLPTYTEGPTRAEPGPLGPGSVVFPSQGYIVPARSRTGSTAGGDYTRKLLRTLSTVSIHESVEGLAGGLAGIAPIGKYIVDQQTTEADAPPSEMPREFGIDEASEGEEDNHARGDSPGYKGGREGKFQL